MNNFECNKIDEDEVWLWLDARAARSHEVNGMLSSRLLAGNVDDDQRQKQNKKTEDQNYGCVSDARHVLLFSSPLFIRVAQNDD